jgi:hypothetical protein
MQGGLRVAAPLRSAYRARVSIDAEVDEAALCLVLLATKEL